MDVTTDGPSGGGSRTDQLPPPSSEALELPPGASVVLDEDVTAESVAAQERIVASAASAMAMPLLLKLKAELDRRTKNGDLDAAFERMPVDKLLGHVKGLLLALRRSGPSVNVNVGSELQSPDAEKLRLLSMTRRTPKQREMMWAQARKQIEGPSA